MKSTTSLRFASVTGLKPEKAAYYRDLHAHPWPAILQQLKKCHIQNYSIFLHEINGQLFLFSYLEYAGEDWDQDQLRIASDPETRRWWQETDPCQSPLPEAAALGRIWSGMEEIFHMD